MTNPATSDSPRTSDAPQLVLTEQDTHLHVSTCWIARSHARKHGWTQLEPARSDAVARDVTARNLTVCRKCKPISRLAWWEKYHRRTT